MSGNLTQQRPLALQNEEQLLEQHNAENPSMPPMAGTAPLGQPAVAAPLSQPAIPGVTATHLDPLLDCLVELARIHQRPYSAEAFANGLPLVDKKLTPSLLPRAAARAHLTARWVHCELINIERHLLPAIVLLRDGRACILLRFVDGEKVQVRFPEGGESSQTISLQVLKDIYAGHVCYVQPQHRFDARTPEVGKVRERHWFWSVVFGNWRLYRDALMAALLINLFALATPLFSMNVYDRVVPNAALETLWVLAIGVCLMLVFDFILKSVRAYIIDVASKRIDVKLSARIMEQILGMRLESRPASVGSFASNLRAFESVRDFVASATVTALVDVPFVVIFILVLLWISPWMIIAPLIAIGLVLLATLLFRDKMHALTESTYRASAQRNATLIESLVGLDTIKTMMAEKVVQGRWEQTTEYLAQMGARLKLLSNLSVNFSQWVQQMVYVVTIIVGTYLIAQNQVSMGAVVAASMLSSRALAPLGAIAGILMQYHHARTGLASVEQLMQMPVERTPGVEFLHPGTLRGQIEFKDVSFTYPGREQPALRNVSIRINPGERVGIIGRIGSGKSTLAKTLLGLYQTQKGAILLDGLDTRQIDPSDLRRAMGLVPQDVTLFYGSLKENISLGAPYADDEAILAAADVAGVTEFANQHPRGFDMLVGERGESLSTGQRQSVAIARAFLNDPPILLLDEPTSSMDFQSEAIFKQRLETYSKGKTLLVITHRMALLDLVDRLIVIDNGVIVADGPKAQVTQALQQGRVNKAN